MVFIPVLPVRKYKALVGTTGSQLSLIHFTQLLTPSRCLGGNTGDPAFAPKSLPLCLADTRLKTMEGGPLAIGGALGKTGDWGYLTRALRTGKILLVFNPSYPRDVNGNSR